VVLGVALMISALVAVAKAPPKEADGSLCRLFMDRSRNHRQRLLDAR
jgi:hypothetical protein